MYTVLRPSTEATHSGPRPRRPWVRIAAALAILAAGAVSLALITYRIQTGIGELVIESDDRDIEVIVKQGGEQVTIIDPRTKNRIELNAGRYELQLAGGGAGLRLSTDTFTLKRGDKTVVTVRRQEPARAVQSGTYFLADREAAGDGEIRRSFFQSPHDLLNNAFLLPNGRQVLYSTGGGDFENNQWVPGTDPALWLGDFTDLTKRPRKYTGHGPGAISLALSGTGRLALSASEDKTLRLWDLDTGQSRLIRREDSGLGAVAFSPDDQHAAYVCDMTIHLCDLNTGNELMSFRGHEARIAKVGFGAAGRRVVSCSNDKTIRVWDVETGKEVRRMAHGHGVSDLAIFPDGRRVLATSADSSIVWDMETGQQVRRISRTASSVAVSPDGRRALFGEYTALWLWDLEKDEKIERWYAHTSPVWRVAFSPDGGRGVSTSFDRTVRIWVMPPGRQPRTEPPVQARQPEAPEVTPKEPQLADTISPKTKAILATLDESIPMGFANGTPLGAVLTYIKQTTFKERKPTDAGIPIYVDPIGLQEAKQTLAATVKIDVNGPPLRVTLRHLLGQLGLAYIVKYDVLIISSSKGIERERNEAATFAADASPKTKEVLAMLDQPIPMSFADAPSLDDMLLYIRQATVTPSFDGIPIFVDPTGLEKAKRSLVSTVSIDLDGVPLKTTLKLMLKQLGLAYKVEDGLLVISSVEDIPKQ